MEYERFRLSRRRFLSAASASAFVAAAHGHLTWAAPMSAKATTETAQAPRILGLRLRTAAPLPAMKAFYHGKLGLPVLAEGDDEITIGGGATPVTFVKAKADEGKPFYHFAFNIPENKIRSARKWQLERSELLPTLPRHRDPSFPDDVVHFRNWNAHSVFFLDPAENVVEYIARHTLENAAPGPFTERDILYASEIAFIVDDVPSVASGVKEHFTLSTYSTPSDAFHAVGDEHGLLLVFQRGRNLGLGRPEPKLADVFATGAEIRAAAGKTYAFPGLPYEITSR